MDKRKVKISKGSLYKVADAMGQHSVLGSRKDEVNHYINCEMNNAFASISFSKIVEWRNVLSCYGEEEASSLLQNDNIYMEGE